MVAARRQDVLVYAQMVGIRRAMLLGREASLDHLKFALSIFTWWPFKPQPPKHIEEVLLEVRGEALARGGPGALADLVPEGMLGMHLEDLFVAQRTDVAAFLQLPFEAGF